MIIMHIEIRGTELSLKTNKCWFAWKNGGKVHSKAAPFMMIIIFSLQFSWQLFGIHFMTSTLFMNSLHATTQFHSSFSSFSSSSPNSSRQFACRPQSWASNSNKLFSKYSTLEAKFFCNQASIVSNFTWRPCSTNKKEVLKSSEVSSQHSSH